MIIKRQRFGSGRGSERKSNKMVFKQQILVLIFSLLIHQVSISQDKSLIPDPDLTKQFRADVGGKNGFRQTQFNYEKLDNGSYLLYFFEINTTQLLSRKSRKEVFELLGRPDKFENGNYVLFHQ